MEIDDDSSDDKAEDAEFIDDDDYGKAPKASKKQKTASGKEAPAKRAQTPKGKAAPAKGAPAVPPAAPTAPRHAPHTVCDLQFPLGQTGPHGPAG